MTDDQRQAWRKALAGHAAVQRATRWRRTTPHPRVGMIRRRQDTDRRIMKPMTDAQCPYPDCLAPVQPGRLCPDHATTTELDRAVAEFLRAPPPGGPGQHGADDH